MMLKYLSPEDGVLNVDKNGVITTQIIVEETDVQHSGEYRCEPGAAPAYHVNVHVLSGKLPAAMQKAGAQIKLDIYLTVFMRTEDNNERGQQDRILDFAYAHVRKKKIADNKFMDNLKKLTEGNPTESMPKLKKDRMFSCSNWDIWRPSKLADEESRKLGKISIKFWVMDKPNSGFEIFIESPDSLPNDFRTERSS
ncbi:unnamed protein product [Lepeophtheirus salmonis]|uniref:(salmon louse) hypothetical protein n=1 Tax=Lepeophtheirus salmonis TaxID=72036 RepID=A0A7R8D0U5_LEPSM|nr:unnamed protein product [Lepeophtheirus salmonis]CAF2961892.1 unnamed protein product [Lepeophtheirus salmonis]